MDNPHPEHLSLPSGGTFSLRDVVQILSVISTQDQPQAFSVIQEGIRNNIIHPFLPDTIFTIEAIRKVQRKGYLEKRKLKFQTENVENHGMGLKVIMTFGPEQNVHPGNHPRLAEYLNRAMKMNFRLMRFPRIGMPINPDLSNDMYENISVDQAQVDLDHLFTVGREIESRGCGIAQIKKIGELFTTNGEVWFKGIGQAPESENKRIFQAVSEWADGDAVAMHIAYGNDYLCTRDLAGSAGKYSVFSPENRLWLNSNYGVVFVTPEELAARVQDQ